jgi:hypothetical protein
MHEREVNTKAIFIILANTYYVISSKATESSWDPPRQQGIPTFLFRQANLLLSRRELQYRYQELFENKLIVVY